MPSNYTSQSVSGYNDTPPADDNSAVESNRIKWATILDKLATPIRNLIASITSQVDAGTQVLFDGLVLTTEYTSTSTQTHTFAATTKKACIQMWGAGAPGAAAPGSAGTNSEAGGAGVYVIAWIDINALGSTVSVTCGDASATFASGNRSSTCTTTGLSLTAPGADGQEGGSAPTTNTEDANVTAIALSGSRGQDGGDTVKPAGGNSFGYYSHPDVSTAPTGCGGNGGIGGGSGDILGGNGKIVIAEYE